jgi:transcription elongation factor Elf1
MSDEHIEYCPWCGTEAERTTERIGHNMIQAHKCKDCETVFRVEVPHRETSIEWTTGR